MLAQDITPTAPAASPASPDDMMKAMMELAKPGPNHTILSSAIGEWTYTAKMWMDPDPKAPPITTSGATSTRPIMGGRYFVSEHAGKMPLPGPDGKLADFDFKGSSTEGYDNVKKKYVATWLDNMGTGIIFMEGSYDAATKSLTYIGEYEPVPGMKTKARQVIKYIDQDHRNVEWFENRGGTEVKSMEISYVRKK